MQINKINQRTQIQTKQNNTQKQNPNFKGIPGVDALATLTADAVENGGLVVSFTLQDMLGTNLPRPIMGLRRNKKENHGEKNLKFAAKELVREFTTGPSMFIIPGTLLTIGKKVFGKTINTPMNYIKSLGEIHASQPLNEVGKAISKQDFFANTFTEIIKNAKNEEAASTATIEKAKEFAQKLADGLKDKKSTKKVISELSDAFTDISKKYAENPTSNFTIAAVKKGYAESSFKNTIGHMVSYADDLVEKAAKQTDTSKVADFIKKQTTNKTVGRFATNLALFACVMSFLQIIPKMYNKAEGKNNAGLKGLMTEETLKNTSTEPAKNNAKSKITAEKKESKNPSFGASLAPVAEKLTSSNMLGKLGKFVEFEGLNLPFGLYLITMAMGIIAPRARQAKDKYDKQEIIRRDITSCAVMAFGEKILRKGFSKVSEKSSGLVVSAKPENFDAQSTLKKAFDYIRPVKGVRTLSTAEIISKYSNIGEYKDGITGFCKFIDNQKGNLSKVFSLTKESKEIVGDLLSAEGKDLATADNKTITTILDKAKDTEAVKKLTDLFKDTKNPWVKTAKLANDRFTAFSVLVLVPVLLGFALPFINEKTTKKRVKEELSNNKINSTVNNTKFNKNLFTQDAKAAKLFSDINNFNK